MRVDVALDRREIRPWRPHTGYLLFGEERDLEFSWLPAVPQGTVHGSYKVAGVRTEVGGVGYHDHNWGNVGMMSIINDWYWARGQAGPYSVIASYITAHKKYGYEPIPIFMPRSRRPRRRPTTRRLVRFEGGGARHLPRREDRQARGPNHPIPLRQRRLDGYVVTFTRKHRDLVANTFENSSR